jgi:hypothetical protein
MAVLLYYYSLLFDKSEKVQSELYYISQKTGKLSTPPSMEDVQRLLVIHENPRGPSEEILMIAHSLAESAKEQQIFDAAKFFYGIVYDLTGMEEIKVKIENLPLEER